VLAVANAAKPAASDKSAATPDYGKVPLTFEQNVGQTDSRVDFIARTSSGTVFLTPTAAVFAIQQSAVSVQRSGEIDRRAGGVNRLETSRFQGVDTPRSPGVALYMQLVGANSAAQPAGLDALPGKANYFIGNDPTKWHTDISTFGRVAYQDVYPGIDL